MNDHQRVYSSQRGCTSQSRCTALRGLHSGVRKDVQQPKRVYIVDVQESVCVQQWCTADNVNQGHAYLASMECNYVYTYSTVKTFKTLVSFLQNTTIYHTHYFIHNNSNKYISKALNASMSNPHEVQSAVHVHLKPS